jgi:hypothetical protein
VNGYRRLFDARSIQSYAENDGDFNDRYLKPFLFSLVKRKIRGQYDKSSAAKGFQKIADLAAQSYYREAMAQDPGIFRDSWHVVFHSGERQKAADLWEREFQSRYQRGEYDWVKKQVR